MSVTIDVHDETASGNKTHAATLEFPSERITVRELIRSRVYQEVKDHNVATSQELFRGLVQPSDAERELNGFRLPRPRQLDWQKQFDAAQRAFNRREFLILVDDRQRDDLDEEIVLTHQTQISFLKLVPLVGG